MNSTAKGTGPSESGIVAEIQALMSEIIAAAEKVDEEKTFSHLTRSKGAVFFLNTKQYDLGSLLSLFRENYGKLNSQTIVVSRSEVLPLGPESAAWIGYGEGRTETKAGVSMAYSFTETWIWQKKDGRWFVTHYHESSG